MSGELKNEIENIKEFILEEIEPVQSQEELQKIRDTYICKKEIEYTGDLGSIVFLR